MKALTRDLTSLKTIAETLNRSINLEEALHESLRIILEILELDTAWVFLKNVEDDGFHLAAHEGLPASLQPGCPPWEDGCQCNFLAEKRKLNDAVNMVRCSRIDRAPTGSVGFTHHASVALKTRNELIGIFNVASRNGGFFSKKELALLTAVGNQMGVAIGRAMIFDRIRAQRLREQAALLELSNALLRNLGVSGVLKEIVRISRKVFEARVCFLGLYENDSLAGQQISELAVDGEAADHEHLRDILEGQTCCSLTSCGRPMHFQLGSDQMTDGMMKVFPLGEPLNPGGAIDQKEPLAQFFAENGCVSVTVVPVHGLVDGRVIGQLAIGHGTQNEVEEHLVTLLANQAALAIEQARLNRVLLTKQALENELDIARDIQKGFLPETAPELTGWSFGVHYEPARQVGGDFYDFIPLPNGSLGLIVADVAGKGVPAALVMVLSRTLVRAVTQDRSSPLEAIRQVNCLLLEQGSKERFLSLFYAVLEPSSGRLTYVRAGHNPPLCYRGEKKEVEPLTCPGMVLGVTDMLVLEERSTILEPGDGVVLYTDGLTEAMDKDNQAYGEERLEVLLKRQCGKPAQELAEIIAADVARFVSGAPPSDDLTLIVLERESFI